MNTKAFSNKTQVSSYDFQTYASAVLCIVTLYVAYRFARSLVGGRTDIGRIRHYPPGPKGLPLLGSLLDLRTDVFTKMKQFAEQYGCIYTIKVGPARIVVLNNKEVIKEAFTLKAADMSHRPNVMMDTLEQTGGIMLRQPGSIHRKNRNLLMSGFRLIRLGHPEFGHHLHLHIDNFKDRLRATNEQPAPICSLSHRLFLEIFSDLMLGEVPDCTSEKFNNVLDILLKTLSPNPMLVLIGKVIPQCIKALLSNWIDISDNFAKFSSYLKEHIQQHKDNCERDPKNLADALLYHERRQMEKKSTPEERSASSGSEGDSDGEEERGTREISKTARDMDNMENICGILLDVFQAGCTSVSASLQWLMLDIAIHQDVQEKIRAEIDELIQQSKDRPSLYMRKDNFLFTKAVMLESLRLHPPVPLGAPHCAVKDTTLAGYDIDKDTIILANFIVASQDKLQWHDASDFRPSRFLDEDNNLASKELLGFSTGPRLCPGMYLTNILISCILVDLLQDFTIHLPAGQTPAVPGTVGIIYNPLPFSVIVKPRV